MAEPNETINTVLWIIVAVLSTLPSILFSLSYLRVKEKRLLILAIAFTLFFVKGLILASKIFLSNFSDEMWWALVALLDITIISLIAFSLSKKE